MRMQNASRRQRMLGISPRGVFINLIFLTSSVHLTMLLLHDCFVNLYICDPCICGILSDRPIA